MTRTMKRIRFYTLTLVVALILTAAAQRASATKTNPTLLNIDRVNLTTEPVVSTFSPDTLICGEALPELIFTLDEASMAKQVYVTHWHWAKQTDTGKEWYEEPIATGTFQPGHYYLVIELGTHSPSYHVTPSTQVYLNGQYFLLDSHTALYSSTPDNAALFADEYYVFTVGSQNGINYSIDGSDDTYSTVLASGFDETTLPTKVSIPETVTFKGVTYTVTSLYNTIQYSDKLISITIPKTVYQLKEALSYCKNLKTVTFAKGSGLRYIDYEAFCGCKSLGSIVIPSSTTDIGEEAFQDCKALNTVTFEKNNKLKSIGMSAFNGCGQLQTITLPASVKSVKDSAFYDCGKLKTVTFAKGSKLSKIEESAFGCGTKKAPITLRYWATDTSAKKAVSRYLAWAKKQGYTHIKAVALLDLTRGKIGRLAAQPYTGKALKPAPKVTVGGKTLKKGTDYTLSYTANKNIGTATVTVKGKGNCSGTLKTTFKITPPKVTIRAPKAGKKQLTARYKAAKGGVRYEVSYRLKGAKKWSKTTSKKTSAIIKKLKSRKTYTVRVRAYKKVGKTTYYGPWSAIKNVKVK